MISRHMLLLLFYKISAGVLGNVLKGIVHGVVLYIIIVGVHVLVCVLYWGIGQYLLQYDK